MAENFWRNSELKLSKSGKKKCTNAFIDSKISASFEQNKFEKNHM